MKKLRETFERKEKIQEMPGIGGAKKSNRLTYVYFEKVNGDTGNVIKVVKGPRDDRPYSNMKEYKKELSKLNSAEKQFYDEFILKQEKEETIKDN